MQRISFVLALLTVVSGAFCQKTMTTADELTQFSDLRLLPAYRDGQSVNQVSTYDRSGGNDDGFNGTYSFIKRNADSSLVIFDAKGPGVINRIWTPTPTEDTFDIYVDDSVFSIKYADLFSGKVKPFTYPLCGRELGGNYCYYPILFADSCKILCRGKQMQFHQVQWRSYPKGTKVKNTFDEFQNVDQTYKKVVSKSVVIGASSRSVLFAKLSGGRINNFQIFPASAFAGNKKDVWISITYNKDTAVFCPVSDFFGFGFGQPSMNSWLLGVKNDTAFCNIPFPFDDDFKIELINKRSSPVRIAYQVSGDNRKRDPAREGRFYSSYSSVKHPENTPSHILLNTQGKGHFIGTVLQCQGTVPGMTLFFEGDDSTVVDGKTTLHGTGSEDYFNGGWYAFPDRWDAALSLPLHGSLGYSLPLCRTGAYRFYLGDKVPFEKSFNHFIEHGPVGNNIPAIYTSLSFYYGDKAPAPLSVLKKSEVYVPDTLVVYPQLTPTISWNGADQETLWAHNTGGLTHVYTVKDETILRFLLDDIPYGNYDLLVDFDKIPTGAKMKVMQRQTELSDWIEMHSADTSRVVAQKAGMMQRTPDYKTISIQFKTTATQNQFFLNRFVLVRRK